MKDNDIRRIILEVEEIKAMARLRAVRNALKGEKEQPVDDDNQPVSQVTYVYDILKEVKHPLHVSEIISVAQERFGIDLLRESIVSALLKKVYRFDRFIKTGPNTFGLIEYRELYATQEKDG
ncbi:MAG: HTH domain-containing protein [Candidatus Cloacimonetes bacterium]|nr:HTH domain-containing protein [Candidatus Cloacimonadota bacterium]